MRAQTRARRASRSVQLLVVIGVLALLGACAEQPTMILIRGAAVPGSDCVLTPEPSLFQTEGVLDVSLASGYLLAPNIENVAPASNEVGTKAASGGGQQGAVFENLSVEGNRVLITEAEVGFEFISAVPGGTADAFPSFEMPIGGTALDPDGGKATFSIAVLNSFHVEQLRSVIQPGQTAILMVTLRFLGITSSDTEVESNEFTFPITICNGCLVGTNCGEASTSQNRCVLPGQDVVYCPETTTP